VTAARRQAFHVERGWRATRLCLRALWDGPMRAFLADPEAAFEAAQKLKQGNTATVARVPIGDRTWIVKRYNVKSRGHRLRQSLKRRSRARNAWRNGERLHEAGIPTARPVALLERHWGPVRGVAYLVMEDLGDLDLRRALATQAPREDQVRAVVELFRRLAALRLSHGDTKATNFLVHGDRIALIDLDAMGAHPRTFRREQAADLARFLANWQDDPAVGRTFADAFRAAGLPVA